MCIRDRGEHDGIAVRAIQLGPEHVDIPLPRSIDIRDDEDVGQCDVVGRKPCLSSLWSLWVGRGLPNGPRRLAVDVGELRTPRRFRHMAPVMPLESIGRRTPVEIVPLAAHSRADVTCWVAPDATDAIDPCQWHWLPR